MVSATNGWAVGDFGAIMHWNGSSWDDVAGLDSDRPSLFAVDIVSGTDGWIVGSTASALRFNGSSWSDFSLPFNQTLNDVDFLSSTDGWAVGNYGTILRWDGNTWSQISSPVFTDLNAVSMVSANEGWAVGDGGTILRWNGANWLSVSSPISDPLESVSMVSATDGWIVGGSDYFLRWNGTTWNTYPSPNNLPFYSVHMLNSTEGWAVGGVFIGPPNWLSGYVYRWNGSAWSIISNAGTQKYLYSVFTLDLNTNWVVGDYWNDIRQDFENIVLQWNGTGYNELHVINPIPSGLFKDVYASSSSDVWIVGDHGYITHGDGNQWYPVESPTTYGLNAVSKPSLDIGWAVGRNGVILRYMPPPELYVNYSSGAPGSYFTFTGFHFPSSDSANIVVNGHQLGTVPTGSSGEFEFMLSTLSAEEGNYVVTASVNPSARVNFILESSEPIHPQEGSGDIFAVPTDIAFTDFINLPLATR
jgi:photosystem II stability/assembly factor-like uncharacterized protein